LEVLRALSGNSLEFVIGLTQNRPNVVAEPCRTEVLSSTLRLVGTILRKSYVISVASEITAIFFVFFVLYIDAKESIFILNKSGRRICPCVPIIVV
jgi:hypothetical protein